MKITNFAFDDDKRGWHLGEVPFDNVNLLVGLSGVGKTKILNSIMALRSIAKGRTLNGVKWKVDFVDSSNVEYTWRGEFSSVRIDDEPDDDEIQENGPIVLSEEIIRDGKTILSRDRDKIVYDDKSSPKLHPSKSSIFLLKEKPIHNIAVEMRKILFYDHTDSIDRSRVIEAYYKSELFKDFKTISEIFNSNLPMPMRLYWVYNKDNVLFATIKNDFCNIFPFVEDLRVDILSPDYQPQVPPPLRDAPLIQMKEKSMKKWIPQFEISAGMFNTLMHLCEIYLCPDNSVILIDELENSLGANCLGPISEEILNNTRKTQYIITSHHPYIINNIKYTYWKIVTRKSDKVNVTKYKYNTNDSSQDPYLQLMNTIESGDEAIQ